MLSVSVLSLSLTVVGGDAPAEEPNDIIWKKGEPIKFPQQVFVVESGQTLYIEPGAIIHLGDNQGIDVKGKMNAVGTADEPIRFTKDPETSYVNPWRSIMFLADEGSVLDHVTISMSRNDIYMSSSSLLVKNSIMMATRSAVIVDSRSGPRSNPMFVNCTVSSGNVYFDFDVSGMSWVTALNTTFNKTRTKIGDPTANLTRQWFLDVQVENSLGEPVESAQARVEDNKSGTQTLVEETNELGVASFVVTEYMDHYGFMGGNREYFTPHSISASGLGYENSNEESIWVNDNTVVDVTLEDFQNPETTLVISGPNYESDPTYIGGSTELSFFVAPGGTQPIQTFYRIDDGSWQEYAAPFKLSGEGLHTITYYSKDPALNTETLKSDLVYLDTTPPEISLIFDPEGEGAYPKVVISGTRLALEATDGGSNVSSIRYRFESGGYQEYLAPITLSNLSHYNISYAAEDNVGNTASSKLWLRVVPVVINNPPQFIGTPIEHGKVGEEYRYHAEAVDPDGDSVVYSLLNPPMGVIIDPATGHMTWTPVEGQEGQNLVFIVASDGIDTDVQVFYIRVQKADEGPTDNMLLILGALGATLAVLGTITGVTEYGRYRFFLFFLVPLYSKLNREKVLNQFLRGQIFGYIMAYPGENYSSIKRALNIENGTLTHHLHILEREGFVDSRTDGRYKRFYPTGITTDEKVKTSMIQKAILKMIRQSPKITQTEIADSLGTSKQVVNYHVKALQKVGLLSVARNGSSLEYEDLSRKPSH